MRVKQTARKSTATPSQASSSGHERRSLGDPVRARMSDLLHTKRKSMTPSFGGPHGVKQEPLAPSRGKQIKIKPRAKPNQAALADIRRLQESHRLLIPRISFHRLVREVTGDISAELGDPEQNLRYQAAALNALQEAAESYLVQMFEDSYLCTLHAKRVTLFVQDMQLCRRLQRHKGFY